MFKTHFTHLLLFTVLMLTIPFASYGQISFSVTVAPPPLPVYVQPVIPQVGYMWAPGYWHWSNDIGYYWVPGSWVLPPMLGLLWTPGYLDWENGVFQFNQGYWAPNIGYYGGVNYGYGYGGEGYGGGEWRGGAFFYNTAVMNVGSNITNVYENKNVYVNNSNSNNKVSYHGGSGGTTTTPTAAEQHAAHEQHIQPTAEQTKHQVAASNIPQLFAKNNGGKPAIAATSKAGDFSAQSAVPAKAAGGEINPASLNAAAKKMAEPEKAVRVTAPAPHAIAPEVHPTAAPAPHAMAPEVHPTASAPHAMAPKVHPTAPAPHVMAPEVHPITPAPHAEAPIAHPTAPPRKEEH